MTKKLSFYLAFATVLALVACSEPPPPEVASDTLETARAQARSNGEFNGQMYRADSPRFTTHKLISHGDSTQSPTCPQGDGWVTNTLIAVDGKAVDKFIIKCSTVSISLGCYLDTDFIKKPFAADEGHCQPTSKVPFPLPKLAK